MVLLGGSSYSAFGWLVCDLYLSSFKFSPVGFNTPSGKALSNLGGAASLVFLASSMAFLGSYFYRFFKLSAIFFFLISSSGSENELLLGSWPLAVFDFLGASFFGPFLTGPPGFSFYKACSSMASKSYLGGATSSSSSSAGFSSLKNALLGLIGISSTSLTAVAPATDFF